MILADLHTHSISSGHATTNTITEMAKQASVKGLTVLGITDHGPATPLAGTESYFRSLKLAPAKREGVQILYGAEVNILDNDGSLDLSDELLAGLDYAIASLHLPTKKPGTMQENTAAYINAMKHPRVRIIGHCDDVRYPVDYDALTEAARKNQVLLEINNASLEPGSYRGNTWENSLSILKCCKERSYPVILSSDSHGAQKVGDFTYALKAIEEAGFPKQLLVNYRKELLTEYFGRIAAF